VRMSKRASCAACPHKGGPTNKRAASRFVGPACVEALIETLASPLEGLIHNGHVWGITPVVVIVPATLAPAVAVQLPEAAPAEVFASLALQHLNSYRTCLSCSDVPKQCCGALADMPPAAHLVHRAATAATARPPGRHQRWGARVVLITQCHTTETSHQFA